MAREIQIKIPIESDSVALGQEENSMDPNPHLITGHSCAWTPGEEAEQTQEGRRPIAGLS